MARIYEYQSKEIARKEGITVPNGRCVTNGNEAEKAARELGKPVVVKAQIWASGRFKAGGIKFANTPEEARVAAEELINSEIKGSPIQKVLVEERLEIDREFYVGVTINNSHKVKGPVLMFSTEGGIDIEEVAAKRPENIVTMNVDYLQGINLEGATELASRLAITGDLLAQIARSICQIYGLFVKYDARVVETNPLVLTRDGNSLYAADCRLVIDDNSVFRHPELGVKVPRDMDRLPTRLEEVAWTIDDDDYRGTGYFTQLVPKIEGRGWLGFHGIGGGGAMLGASAFINRGFKLANYADTSGDPTASKVYRVIKCIFSQPIDGYVLMGACLANQEQWHHAHAIVKALREEAKERPGFPVVLLLAGNKEKEAHEIIKSGLADVDLCWELYGRDYIYDTEFIADRVDQLVMAYMNRKSMK